MNFDAIKNYAGQKSFQEMAQNNTEKRKKEQEERKITDIRDIFIQKNERSLAVKASAYGIKELKEFNKELRLAKDKLLGER